MRDQDRSLHLLRPLQEGEAAVPQRRDAFPLSRVVE